MLKSEICELLDIKYPIFQGGMAWIADGKLTAAVSEGGGLGIIAAGNAPADYVREQVQIARSLTNKPIGVNIMLLSPFAEEVAEAVCEEKVEVVTTGAGNPSKYMKRWTQAGIKVIPVVASAAMAKLVSRMGASAVIAEGGESGGHVGDLTTMVLVPQVCDATNLPVIAAGGIADGRGMAAAFMLGACGIQMGTRFLSARECTIHPNYREKIQKLVMPLHQIYDDCKETLSEKFGVSIEEIEPIFHLIVSSIDYYCLLEDKASIEYAKKELYPEIRRLVEKTTQAKAE